jgi:hypothetical protein
VNIQRTQSIKTCMACSVLAECVCAHQEQLSVTQITELLGKDPLLSPLLTALLERIAEQECTINLLTNENKKMKGMMINLSHQVLEEEEPDTGQEEEEIDDAHYHLLHEKILHVPTALEPQNMSKRRVYSADMSTFDTYMSSIHQQHELVAGSPDDINDSSFETYMSGSTVDICQNSTQIAINDAVKEDNFFPIRHSRMWLPPKPEHEKHPKKRRTSHPHHRRSHLTMPNTQSDRH